MIPLRVTKRPFQVSSVRLRTMCSYLLDMLFPSKMLDRGHLMQVFCYRDYAFNIFHIQVTFPTITKILPACSPSPFKAAIVCWVESCIQQFSLLLLSHTIQLNPDYFANYFRELFSELVSTFLKRWVGSCKRYNFAKTEVEMGWLIVNMH